MLVVRREHRKYGIATLLISATIEHMLTLGCKAIFLESEVKNTAALSLYRKLGFVRDSRLFKYYFRGTDAYMLALNLR